MTPETIASRESKFATTLTDSSGKKFTAGNPIDIGDGFSIIPISPGFKTYFYQTRTVKTQICLHFTVGVITGDVASLTKENNHMSVPYVVDRSGHIYRLFDDAFWSYHLGSTAIGGNAVMSKQSIGIEISNYGPLKDKEQNGNYIDAYGNLYTKDPANVDFVSYRGYCYYAKMTEIQKKAVAHLLKYLSEKHSIPLTFKEMIGDVFDTAAEAVAYKGIFCHSNVRKDKYDMPPEFTLQIKDTLDDMNKVVEQVAAEPEPEKPAEDPEPAVKDPQPETDVVRREFVVKENENGDPYVAEVESSEPAEEQVHLTWFDKFMDWLKSLFKSRQ